MAAAAPKAAPKETEEGGEKKKSPIIKIAIFVVAGIALIGTGFGSAILFMKLASPADENPLAIVIEKKKDATETAAAAATAADAENAGKPKKVKVSDVAAATDKKGEGEKKPTEGEKKPAEGEKKADGKSDSKGKAIPEEEKFVTSYYEFPANFTTNLRNSRKFIQAGLGVGTQYDATVIENLKKHELAIRSEVLLILSNQTEADLAGIDNRKKVQDQIKDGINKVLMERERFGGIENVFFTTMVMQ
jgi:flagellar FliL protein